MSLFPLTREPDRLFAAALPAVGFGDALPILPGTQLCLELALLRNPPSLRELADILERDPVAVLRLFALAATEFPAQLSTQEDLVRVEDCVASLGTEQLLHAFCRQAPMPSREQPLALAFAQHSCAVARMCREIAEATGLPGEEAFLVGLLHNLSELPERLGRMPFPSSAQVNRKLTSTPTRQYALPSRLQQTLDAVYCGDPASPWTAVVGAAYELLGTAAFRG